MATPLLHRRSVRNGLAKVGYHPAVKRTAETLQVDRLINGLVFPLSTDIRILDTTVSWTVPTIYSYLKTDYSTDSNTWFEGAYSQGLADAAESADVVYDVGARWGYQTLLSSLAMDGDGEVVSFEPYPPHREILRRNVTGNDLPTDVRIENFALGDSIQTVEFDLARGEHSPQLDPSGDTSRTVTMVRLDDYVEHHEPPEVVDVDIEGAELSFLRGARETLAEHGPTLFLEVHDREMVLGEWEEIYELLHDLDYELELVGDGTSEPIDSPPEEDTAHDLIARPAN